MPLGLFTELFGGGTSAATTTAGGTAWSLNEQGTASAVSTYAATTNRLYTALAANTATATNTTSVYLAQNAGLQMMAAPTQALTTCTTTTGSTIVWFQEDNVTPDQYMALAQARVVRFHERSAEEQRRYAEQQRIANEAYEKRMAEFKIARARSRDLLVAHLTREQLDTFEKLNWFIVEGGRSRQRYRIRDGLISGNIDVLQGSRVTHRLCCHLLDGAVPIYDHLLAQKLHLQYDEENFLRIANRHAA